MPTDDRNRDNPVTDPSTDVPMEDLKPEAIDAESAEQVRGGAGKIKFNEFTIKKSTDTSTP